MYILRLNYKKNIKNFTPLSKSILSIDATLQRKLIANDKRRRRKEGFQGYDKIYLHLPLMKKVQLTKLISRTKVGRFREAMTGFPEVPLSIAAGLLR